MHKLTNKQTNKRTRKQNNNQTNKQTNKTKPKQNGKTTQTTEQAEGTNPKKQPPKKTRPRRAVWGRARSQASLRRRSVRRTIPQYSQYSATTAASAPTTSTHGPLRRYPQHRVASLTSSGRSVPSRISSVSRVVLRTVKWHLVGPIRRGCGTVG